MGYIGIAAAVGQIIDIPVVIRSLADSLALADHDTLPLDIGEQLLSYLATESSFDENHPNFVVSSYYNQWWTWRRPPTHNAESNILGPLNVDACLSHHRDSVNAARERAEIKPITDAFITSGQATSFSAGVPDEHMCGTCKEARVTCADLIDKLRQAQAFAATMRSASMAEAELARREIAGAHLFGETVVLKESALPDQNTPQESQWQFGASLTREDVLQLNRPMSGRIHDGYNESLPSGLQNTNSSSGTAGTARESNFSAVGTEVNVPPSPTSHTLPPGLDTTQPPPETPIEHYRRVWFAGRRTAPPATQVDSQQVDSRQYFAVDDSDDEVEILSRPPSPRGERGPTTAVRPAAPGREMFSSSEGDDDVSHSQRSPPAKRLRKTAVPSAARETAVHLGRPIGRDYFADSDTEMADGTDSGAAAPRTWLEDSEEDVPSPPHSVIGAALDRRHFLSDSDDDADEDIPGRILTAGVLAQAVSKGREFFAADSDTEDGDQSDLAGIADVRGNSAAEFSRSATPSFREADFADLGEELFLSPAASECEGSNSDYE